MIGGGDTEWQGRTLHAAEALRGAGLTPAVLAPKEGLAITNGTSLMSALLSLATVDAAMLCDTADVVGAMTLEALQATPAAFDPRIHAARPYSGQVHVAANIRALTEGSSLLMGAGDQVPGAGETDNPTPDTRHPTPPKVQDAYSLRCIPQVHGAARDTVGYVRSLLLTELNSANDNPLIFQMSGEGYQVTGNNDAGTQLPAPNTPAVLSGGNFHGAPLAVAADILGIGVCQLANISERRQARLLSGDGYRVSGAGKNAPTDTQHPIPVTHSLPTFLTEHGGLNSGFMMLQYTSAALASENKSLAHPASVDTIPTSNGWEDVNSMGPIAARHARAIVANTARILALEALCAAQAIDFRLRILDFGLDNDTSSNPKPKTQNPKLGRGTRAAYELIRAHVPFIERDEDIRPHIAAAERLVLSGELASQILSSKF
jgi:histidine ammonia-lyase